MQGVASGVNVGLVGGTNAHPAFQQPSIVQAFPELHQHDILAVNAEVASLKQSMISKYPAGRLGSSSQDHAMAQNPASDELKKASAIVCVSFTARGQAALLHGGIMEAKEACRAPSAYLLIVACPPVI